jgi:magnesium-transporting ATPase (P-type)
LLILKDNENTSVDESTNFNDRKSTTMAMMPHTIVRPLHPDKNLLKAKHQLQQSDEESFSDLGIIKQFPFSSSLQRMSVIVKELKEPHFDLFTKGSPEKILEFSRPDTSKKLCRFKLFQIIKSHSNQ